ncbi:MAG: hypothetical protein KGL98_01970 [Gammaproteobacteria bacterium]|nr:hypothetical protein [Gammaproteobacteria bacterium]MBU6509538.1 hypothetical protein [Gammaproteobacteria bacterium]MDE1983842.1 hypothetical protein [Gammaproteobacteria bacterium]MDE2109362.1 hypothetical protein [Gammaproteobacteria bacterium]MDE2459990.1 hypothetical protein [Gammaproteobacteria bacterium]
MKKLFEALSYPDILIVGLNLAPASGLAGAGMRRRHLLRGRSKSKTDTAGPHRAHPNRVRLISRKAGLH